MILIDSSAWIDFFRRNGSPAAQLVDVAIDEPGVVVGDLVAVEVLQGVRHDRQIREIEGFFRTFPQVALCEPASAGEAARNYRRLRSRGVTVRSTIDVIIASWCLAHDASLVHNDRDMRMMEVHLGLRTYVPTR